MILLADWVAVKGVAQAQAAPKKGNNPTMIEFRRLGDPTRPFDYFIDVDGERILELHAEGSAEKGKGNYLRIDFESRKAQEKVLSQPISLFPPLEYFYFNLVFSPVDVITHVVISPKSSEDKRYRIRLVSEPDLSAWAKAYSFSSYYEALGNRLKALNDPDVTFEVNNYDADFNTLFEAGFIYSSPDVPITDEIARHMKLLIRLHREVEAALTTDNTPFEIRRVGGEWIEGGVLGRYFRGRYQLYISDEPVERVEVTGGGEAADGEDSVWFTIHIPGLEVFEPIGGCTFNQIPASVDEFILSTGEGVEFLKYVHMRRAESGGGAEYVFSLHPDLWEWQRPYSPGAYFQEIKSMAATFQPWVDVGLHDLNDGLAKGFYVKFSNLPETLPLAQLLTRCVDSLSNMQAGVDSSLSGGDRATLVSRFSFPKELRVPCEQYLLFFTRFLEDLGVEATADIRHEAGQVLFSVTPASKEEALDRIHEALMIYLGMSASPVNDVTSLDYEIAVQRLVAEVQTLQSRVTRARAELQLKEATIQQQQITIERLRPDGGLMLTSLKEMSPHSKEDDREEVINGLVAFKKFEWHFLEVRIPELYRRVKQLFGEKKK